ncbi:hypothetical protein BT63DRAFT_439011 [Microthyrium microscopicum]|uniref:AB hydrolase-1 domain-containing protein n=1 Tax=Microthyrium microscopicum TaxID=703497 RepID=A0A6A6UDY1_9PEZI|nr:hypothetical protein BT63DRAFT_439011 [Microthyrium microscopicum]
MPKKTLLLVFIHGFQGGDDTFARFPSHIKALLSHALPHLNVLQITYPKFETRGDLGKAVSNFKEWLTNKVIDLEVATGTPSPTIDPSVRTILIGHSMGGIVGAETILSITGDQPIPHKSNPSVLHDPTFMFPSILGLLAFDTPYLGISPGVVAHGAESHYQNLKGAWSAYNSVSSAFGMGASNSTPPAGKAVDASKALPAPPSANDPDVAAVPAWQRLGRYAMYAGVAGAIVAGGAAAYANRGQISEGWNWATGHLEFVGCLARGAELEKRVANITEISATRGLGFRNMFTVLGRDAGTLMWRDASADAGGMGSGNTSENKGGTWAHSLDGAQRTFCQLPKDGSPSRKYFEATVNDKATSEINAHVNIFTSKENPGYHAMAERVKGLLTEWVEQGWAIADDEPDAMPGATTMDEEPEIIDEEETELLAAKDDDVDMGVEAIDKVDEEPHIVKKEDLAGMDENPWK